MINLQTLFARILSCPMVIETGTTTSTMTTGPTTCNWTYKKWSDGRYELWGIINSTTYQMTNAYGNAYYRAYTLNLPTGFQYMPDFVSIQRGQGDGYDLIHLEVSNANATRIVYYAIDTYSSSRAYQVCVYVTGFYK